jgi:hypothetical protein
MRKRTANKTEKREKREESANYTNYAKGREYYNEQLGIAMEVSA